MSHLNIEQSFDNCNKNLHPRAFGFYKICWVKQYDKTLKGVKLYFCRIKKFYNKPKQLVYYSWSYSIKGIWKLFNFTVVTKLGEACLFALPLQCLAQYKITINITYLTHTYNCCNSITTHCTSRKEWFNFKLCGFCLFLNMLTAKKKFPGQEIIKCSLIGAVVMENK